MIPFVDLKAQYRSIKGQVDAAISGVLDRSDFVLGSEVAAFEAEFAAYCDTRFAVGTNSGTSALHLAMLAAGIGPGDEVITVSFTFVASVAAIRHAGAIPVLVEVSPGSYTMDPARIEAAITPRTKAIMPVHLYGQCADMHAIVAIARRHGLVVIEDAAQAHGAYYKARRAGGLGDIACFSFYPGKNLGAYGEAGAVVTDNPEYDAALRLFRDHGARSKYDHIVIGYNYRLEGIQGAVLRVKLRHLEDWNIARRAHASSYRRLLAGGPVAVVSAMPYGDSAYHLFPVFAPRRDELQAHLAARGIATGIHYPIPVHLQKAHADLGYVRGDFPVSERASAETLSLPMYPELSDEAIETVAKTIFDFYANPARSR